MMEKVKLFIAGAGNRGFAYAGYALKNPGLLEIVGVAEPRDDYRNLFVEKYNIKKEFVFKTWQEAAQRPKFADAVIIATQDKQHVEPTEAFAARGYHILLEKPMAESLENCRRIYNAVKDKDTMFGVCHVLRYAPYTRKIKSIIDSGAIGEIINIQRLEPVGFWHYAHSYVRGNWRNEKEASFMLLAKSCHDIDWIHYIMGKKCTGISSFGSLKFFKKENQPAGASERCLDCKVESTCPYSAKKIYLGFLKEKNYEWPLNVITTDFSEEAVTRALKTGPYGRCVFVSDNDVVDNQVVIMQFENAATASLTMTGFTEMEGGRRTTIFGTKGEIRGNEDRIEVYDFLTRKTTVIKMKDEAGYGESSHGGGDFALMDHFVKAIANNDPSQILSGPKETFESHMLVFEAEKSRKEKRMINL